jgi:hypothetical protein
LGLIERWQAGRGAETLINEGEEVESEQLLQGG